jgi:hypothetical protein
MRERDGRAPNDIGAAARDAAASASAGCAPDGPAGAPRRQPGEGRAVLADTGGPVATLAEVRNSWE